MAYKVRVGRFEIECDTAEELAALIVQVGDGGGDKPASPKPSAPNGSVAAPANGSAQSRDQVLLRQLIQAGEGGIDAGTVSSLLGGARGRAVPLAVKRWAVRVGLADSEENNVLTPARPGGQRGWRLSSGALGAAKAMQQGDGGSP